MKNNKIKVLLYLSKKIFISLLFFGIYSNINSQQYLSTKFEYDLSNRLEVIYYKDSAMTDYGIPAYTFQYDGVGNRLYNVNYYFLPVSLLNFTANNLSNNALLTFQTASEINNSGFLIQRSFNGYQFDSIGFVKGNGNSNQLSNYRYFDYQPTKGLDGVVYYRLKQVDYDGRSELSEIKAVYFMGQNSIFKIYPNPVTDILTIESTTSETFTLQLYNLSGQLQLSKTFSEKDQIDLSNISQGVYYIRIWNEYSSIVRKIVVQ